MMLVFQVLGLVAIAVADLGTQPHLFEVAAWLNRR